MKNIKIPNGLIFIAIGVIHSWFGMSMDAFGRQFAVFSDANFYKVSKGLDELPIIDNIYVYEVMSAFWFVYFGLLMVVVGFLVFSVEKKKQSLPYSFVLSYFFFVFIGSYMIPNSGITFIMLPHAIFMLIQKIYKDRFLEILKNKKI
jgi:hypothetical protein